MQLMKKAMAARAAQVSANTARRISSEQPQRENSESAQMDGSTPVTSAPTGQDQSAGNAMPITLPSNVSLPDPTPAQPRQASEHVDEILQTLKTTFPLLILSLETMVDQIHHKFKPSPDEEVYRNICMLLSDAVQVQS